MSSIVPSYTPVRPGIDEIKAKLCDLSQDLDKFAPEHRNQVMVDRLRQQKLRAMISLAKAQQFLAETDVLIADYNLQAVADEFEHMKKERYTRNSDIRSPQDSELKTEKLVLSTDCLGPANTGNLKDVSSCTPLVTAVGHSKSIEKGTELTPKLSTHYAESHRKSRTDRETLIPKDIQPINKNGGSEPTTKFTEATSKVTKTSSKTHEPTSKVTKTSSKTHEPTKSKTSEESSSKTKEAAMSKTYKESSSKTKEATTSKTHEAPTSTKEATTSKTHEAATSTKEATTSKTHEATTSAKEVASHRDTDIPAPGLKSKKRKRSKSKSKENKHRESKSKDNKRHKSSHKHAASSHAPAASSDVHTASLGPIASTHVPAASLNVHAASLGPVASSHVHAASLGPVASTHVPAASLNVHAASLGPVASTRAPAASSSVNIASSQVHYLLAHAPNCDCLKSCRTNKEKTLLNTSISPIKKIVEAKGVQTDEKTSKKDILKTDAVKTLTKGVQTDNVIILHVGSQTARENSPDIDDEETLLLDTLPAPHSHSTAITLAKALQQIKSQKTSVLERLCPTAPDGSFLSQNDVLQKIELMIEDEEETVEERPGVVKMELPDDLPNTSTEVLVNNLYKDIMKAKDQDTAKGIEPKGKVTKRGLWKILDKC